MKLESNGMPYLPPAAKIRLPKGTAKTTKEEEEQQEQKTTGRGIGRGRGREGKREGVGRGKGGVGKEMEKAGGEGETTATVKWNRALGKYLSIPNSIPAAHPYLRKREMK